MLMAVITVASPLSNSLTNTQAPTFTDTQVNTSVVWTKKVKI